MSTAQGLFGLHSWQCEIAAGWAEVVFPLQRRGKWQLSSDWKWCCFMFIYRSPQTNGAHQQRPSEIKAKRPWWLLKYYFGVLSTTNKLRKWFYVTAQVVQLPRSFFFFSSFILNPSWKCLQLHEGLTECVTACPKLWWQIKYTMTGRTLHYTC